MLQEFIPAIISIAFIVVAFLYAFVSDPSRIHQPQAIAKDPLHATRTGIQSGTGSRPEAN